MNELKKHKIAKIMLVNTVVISFWNMTVVTAGNPELTILGKVIYQQSCLACHGADGAGAFPGVPDLTEVNGSLAKPDITLIKNITDGYQSPGSPMAMPPKGGNPSLTDDNIKAVLGYMREEFSK
jgi:cytochrome c5